MEWPLRPFLAELQSPTPHEMRQVTSHHDNPAARLPFGQSHLIESGGGRMWNFARKALANNRAGGHGSAAHSVDYLEQLRLQVQCSYQAQARCIGALDVTCELARLSSQTCLVLLRCLRKQSVIVRVKERGIWISATPFGPGFSFRAGCR